MVWSLGSYSAAETRAYGLDAPIIVGHNALRDAIVAKWTTDGLATGADVTALYARASRAYDGRGSAPTHADYLSSPSTIHFNVQIPPSTVDTLAAIFTEPFAAADVTASVSSSGAFSGGADQATFAGPFAAADGDPRLVRSFNGSRYDGVEYLRLTFVKNAGSWNTGNVPRLSELVVGRGRIRSSSWDFGSDLDPSRASVHVLRARSGEVTRYVRHHSRYEARHEQDLFSQSLVNVDDQATMRTLGDESRSFQRPVLYIPRPLTALTSAYLGFGPRGGLDMPQQDYDTHQVEFRFAEQPPYRKREAA